MPTGSLFGTDIATMVMLSTAAYVLTMDVFGPKLIMPVEMWKWINSLKVWDKPQMFLLQMGITEKQLPKALQLLLHWFLFFYPVPIWMKYHLRLIRHSTRLIFLFQRCFFEAYWDRCLYNIYQFSAMETSVISQTAWEVVNEVWRKYIDQLVVMT